MQTIEDFKLKHDHRKELEKKYENISLELEEIGKQLTIQDFEELKYDELKQNFGEWKKYLVMPLLDEVRCLINKKRLVKYPQLKGVRYYPILNDLNLSEEEKVKLDRYLFSGHKLSKRVGRLEQRHSDVLLEAGMIEKVYEFSCNCFLSLDCSSVKLTQEEMDKYFSYWNKTKNGELISNEEKNETNNGTISYYCSEELIDIQDMDDYENNTPRVHYNLIVEPDLSTLTL